MTQLNSILSKKKQLAIYIVLTLALIITKYAEFFTKYSLSSFVVSKILLGAWLICNSYLLFRYWSSEIVKAYFGTLIWIAIIVIYFAGILATPLIIDFLCLGDTQAFRLKQNIIIQSKSSPLSGSYIVIFEDNGILKKRIGHQKDEFPKNDTTVFYVQNALSAELISKNAHFLTVKYIWDKDSLTVKHETI